MPGINDSTFESAALGCLDDVARFARSLTQDVAEAEDLLQETYLRAFRGRHTYHADGEMRRWLFTICKHAFLRGRERERAEVVSLDADPTDETLEAARLHNRLVTSGDAAFLDQLDLAPAIAAAIATLPPGMRLVVVLVDLEGHGYADAAALLDLPIGTVRSRLFRARRILQELLVRFGRDAGFETAQTPRRGDP
jgi:RNA polymerase sigma-70 factor (ECF subfamily)